MNYGKDATEKRLQAVNSRSRKYRSRIFLTFLKTCCVLCLFSVLVISSIGIGIVMGIIDNSPCLLYTSNVRNLTAELYDGLRLHGQAGTGRNMV